MQKLASFCIPCRVMISFLHGPLLNDQLPCSQPITMNNFLSHIYKKGYLELKLDWFINKINFACDLTAIVSNGASVVEGFAGNCPTDSVN